MEASVDIEHYRRRLLSLEQDLLKKLGREVEVARETRDDQAEIGDIAVVDELKEEYFAVAETDSVKLAQVRAALKRIDDGTFGRCLVDDQPINEKRLEAVPWTPYCLKHQQELEETARLRTPSW
jgi:DnaK suppressor protein